ncbi:hypothetical protein UVI_02046470 [Ustilaginoidea virens]|uniref:RING finger domain-containing protein n=1 Tax=Ustilaginoidea virens TaxID=1159556 RepID=A0A1B5L0J5_USTVR|nr:hypothetical protein UVI_02046470 [Ustilaginoidea virens]
MDSRQPSLDLEKELTCSICTELLYQPLTLLDCLHTFCGACLKEWFRFQAAKAERAPTPPSHQNAIFTCPSCRSFVRETKHNATVVTLLDMFVTANPAKARSEADKEEMMAKYKPGDQVLPKLNARRKTRHERRADEEDRRLVDQVREMSFRETIPGQSLQEATPRRRHSRSNSRRRIARDSANPPRSDDSSRQDSDTSGGALDHRRRRRQSDSRQRRVEHQSSLRSLIGTSEMSDRDIEREIEEFARQIQEEGLLDGLDLDNIDLSRDDELSRRITDAYRRRQRERSNADARNPPEAAQTDTRLRVSENRSSSRSRGSSRSASRHAQPDDRSRPPPAGPTSLEARDLARRPRRRTASSGRSVTAPIFPLAREGRLAARSQTDLDVDVRSHTSDLAAAPRQNLGESQSRNSSSQSVPVSSHATNDLSPTTASGNNASFASRVPQWNPNIQDSPPPPTTALPIHEQAEVRSSRAHPPAELAIVHSSASSPLSSPTASAGHQRARSQLYPEPCINCSRCNKQHIEYELHYHCATCAGGQWNICLGCYRSGKGCQYWFGFGYGAWKKWEKMRQQGDESLAAPHMLTASRYLPPPSSQGGADGRRTLTTDDPKGRLETGTFCARCMACTNDCYWRCDVCNEGDWGFCNDCVNQGRSCTHMLLPLTHEAEQATGRPRSPRSPGRPPTATIYSGPQATSIGPFKPLTFSTRCDICQDPIPPSHVRYHCSGCTSALVPDAPPGDYDICSSCYNGLVSSAQISPENGHSGWRRCLNGHRMAVIGFTEGKVGQWRFVERDIVGGHALRSEPFEDADHKEQGLQKWSWKNGSERWERLATKEVSAAAPTSVPSASFAQSFPPDGGAGMRANARWAWYPQAGSEDELLFPKGAEVQEIEDVNGDWFFGTYMGAKGLFPAPYVRMSQQPS